MAFVDRQISNPGVGGCTTPLVQLVLWFGFDLHEFDECLVSRSSWVWCLAFVDLKPGWVDAQHHSFSSCFVLLVLICTSLMSFVVLSGFGVWLC